MMKFPENGPRWTTVFANVAEYVAIVVKQWKMDPD